MVFTGYFTSSPQSTRVPSELTEIMFCGETMLIDLIKKFVDSRLFATGKLLPVLVSHFTSYPEYVPPITIDGSKGWNTQAVISDWHLSNVISGFSGM